MNNTIRIDSHDNTVEVYVQGRLTQDAYRELVPAIEDVIQRNGKIRVLFVMSDFHGWTAGALWDDLKFDLKHFNDIERLAIVGEKHWQQGMAVFCKPFTTAKVQYFTADQENEAREWLREPIRTGA
jgi:hypothetical protein